VLRDTKVLKQQEGSRLSIGCFFR